MLSSVSSNIQNQQKDEPPHRETIDLNVFSQATKAQSTMLTLRTWTALGTQSVRRRSLQDTTVVFSGGGLNVQSKRQTQTQSLFCKEHS